MNRAARTLARPPPMKLLPRHLPDWRVNGARPASAAIWRRLRLPSSGSSASMVRAVTDPTPGTEASRSSFSHDTGVDLGELAAQRLEQARDAAFGARRSTLLTLAFGDDHLDDLPPPRHQVG